MLTPRLSVIASCVRNGSTTADVGCDHAHIIIDLIKSDRISKAVASDINEGPLSKARENIEKNGVGNSVTAVLTDGLKGIERFSPEDIIIAGMGGELIAKIISESDFVKKDGIRLILQPMTTKKELREYLFTNGFFIEYERYAIEERRIYQIIVAGFGNNLKKPYSACEMLIGRLYNENDTEIYNKLLIQTISVYTQRLNGKKMGGYDADCDEKIIKELQEKM